MDTLLSDLRFAVRTLLASRWFVAVAVVCLALGIGVNTAIFSVTNSVILRPFPYGNAERLLAVSMVNERRGETGWGFSYADYLDLKAQSRAFADLAAMYGRSITLTGGEDAERISAEQVTPNVFDVIGITPAVGRAFLPEDGRAGAPNVALISHDLWERRFGGDSALVGRTLMLSGAPYTVIGVLPAGINFPETQHLWVPVRDSAPEPRDARYLRVVGLLAPGATAEQARAEVAAIAKRLAGEYPATNERMGATVKSLHEDQLGPNVFLVIYLMQGSVAFVLLIACANVANLLLARATGRERELAVRSALGASRGRLVRQLLTESIILALVGGALGVLVAQWTIELIVRLMPADDLPFWMHFEIERNALLFTLAASVLTGLLFGVMPALRMSRTDVQSVLKEGGRGSTAGARAHRMRNTLVVAEIALSVVLLAGAGLMVKSFLRMNGEAPGFDPSNLLTMRVGLPGIEFDSASVRARTLEEITARVAALPGVAHASYVSLLPLIDDNWRTTLAVEGQTFERGAEPLTEMRFVHPNYFSTLGIALRAGRGFTDREAVDSANVAVVGEELARRFWPDGSALGRRIRQAGDSAAPWLTIVGIIPDTKLDLEDPRAQLAVYVPYPVMRWRAASLVARTTVPPATLVKAVRREVRAVHAAIPTYDIRTLEEARHHDLWPFRLYGAIFGLFSTIALLLAAVGVYGVMAYGVLHRTHEIGVRMALGAERRDVLRLVVRQGLLLTAIGLTTGLLGALAVTGTMQSLLYGVRSTDPLTYLVISLVLATVAAIACWIPARRATRVDPMVALRYE
jgi:putative ABC transport system permease protein